MVALCLLSPHTWGLPHLCLPLLVLQVVLALLSLWAVVQSVGWQAGLNEAQSLAQVWCILLPF